MNEKLSNILIVEDEKVHAELIRHAFKLYEGSMGLSIVHSLHEAHIALEESIPDMVVADFLLPDGEGIGLLPAKNEELPYPVVIMTCHGDEQLAVDVMKAGALDYIVKSRESLAAMPHICRRSLREWGHIIDRKRAEEELEIEKNFNDSVLDCLPGIFCLFNYKGKILRWNKNFEKESGYSYGEISKMHPLDFFVNRDKPFTEDAIREVFETGQASKEAVLVTKDGSKVPYFLSGKCIMLGKTRCFVGTGIDISKHKEMEEKLMQSEKLRAIGVMAAGVAHDFNNILSIIHGNTQLLLQDCESQVSLMDKYKVIQDAAKDGAEIVRRLSEFTREKEGPNRFVSVNIEELIKHAIVYTKPRWENMALGKGIIYNIKMNSSKCISPIQGNPSELREVFVNLINNALDAMREGGTLSFKTWDENETVNVSVSDTGAGMSEDVRTKIFDPFFTTKGVKGSGLGMSIVYGIIKRHNGKIEVKSEIGKGCTFILDFPMCHRYRISHNPVSIPVKQIKDKNCRILVVDGEVEICKFMKSFLIEKGHNVKAVDNGADAIGLLKSESFDLVLSDLGMPGVSGLDILRTIEKLNEGPKVGLITGWDDHLDISTDKRISADFIINKPINFSLLNEQIQNVLAV